MSGPALFTGSQGAKGEFHYYNDALIRQRLGADPYRGKPLTRSRGIRIAYAWLRAIGAPIPHGSSYVQLRPGMTVIGGTGLCCFKSLAVLAWNGKRDSFGNIWSASDMIYVADAGTIVEADIGPLTDTDGNALSHPCSTPNHSAGDGARGLRIIRAAKRDRNGIAVGAWCFDYARAARGTIIAEIGNHGSWVNDPRQLMILPCGTGSRGPLQKPFKLLVLNAREAVFRQKCGQVTYRSTLVPAFPGLVGSIWELSAIRAV
jgi:hypothetical protein